MAEVSDLTKLRAALSGYLIEPREEAYDQARRVWNGMIDRRPAAIARCATVTDAVRCVEFARTCDMTVAIRGGGHNVAGNAVCDGGLVIDLSLMKEIVVDAPRRRVRAGGGVVWGELDAATQQHGLATTGGLMSTTGIAGFTLGGGLGHLMRSYGLACDNLLSAETVTADGRHLTVNGAENDDLFWARRGGGGNFGVVTSLEVQLHPVKDIYGGPMFFELSEVETILRFYRDFIAEAPEQLGAFPAFQIAPPLPFIPEDRHGDTFIAMVACWAGPVADGEKALKPFHDVAPVVAEFVGAMPYPVLNSAFDGLVPPGLQHYWKANFVK